MQSNDWTAFKELNLRYYPCYGNFILSSLTATQVIIKKAYDIYTSFLSIHSRSCLENSSVLLLGWETEACLYFCSLVAALSKLYTGRRNFCKSFSVPGLGKSLIPRNSFPATKSIPISGWSATFPLQASVHHHDVNSCCSSQTTLPWEPKGHKRPFSANLTSADPEGPIPFK